ncbi:hypothetical protein [Nostoc sp.]|uniref:hypothetical protein n=1 Tax=Nostoc sp. TaxID=1180 RepID=UPI002FF9AFD1
MTREEDIKAAIIVTPDMIGYASPETNQAAEDLGEALFFFVDYVESLEPKLERLEAMRLAAAFLKSLPEMCQQNSEVTDYLKELATSLLANPK